MDAQTPAIRELSQDECETASGGLWGLVAIAVGSIATGVALGIATAPEKVLVPKLDLPPSEEPVGW
jgi:hypothetical protein